MTTDRQRLVFSSLFLSTGAALLVYIISGISLLATATMVIAAALVVAAVIWSRAGNNGQAEIRRLLKAGIVAGLIATAAYDLSRFILIEITGIAFWPFDIFNVFGQALVGVEHSGPWVRLAGLIYHFANGIGFALSYAVVLGKRGIWAGIGWAMLLEFLMVTVYPGWLDLRALNEFLQVSIVGHIVYGISLGYTARWYLDYLEKSDAGR